MIFKVYKPFRRKWVTQRVRSVVPYNGRRINLHLPWNLDCISPECPLLGKVHSIRNENFPNALCEIQARYAAVRSAYRYQYCSRHVGAKVTQASLKDILPDLGPYRSLVYSFTHSGYLFGQPCIDGAYTYRPALNLNFTSVDLRNKVTNGNVAITQGSKDTEESLNPWRETARPQKHRHPRARTCIIRCAIAFRWWRRHPDKYGQRTPSPM